LRDLDESLLARVDLGLELLNTLLILHRRSIETLLQTFVTLAQTNDLHEQSLRLLTFLRQPLPLLSNLLLNHATHLQHVVVIPTLEVLHEMHQLFHVLVLQ
jgi:hypothetical protein